MMRNAFAVSHQVFESVEFKELVLIARYLYVYLSKWSNRYADNEGYFWVSNRTLAEEAPMDIKSVIKAKKLLEEARFLEYRVQTFSRNPLKTSVYRLTHFLDISKRHRGKNKDKNDG